MQSWWNPWPGVCHLQDNHGPSGIIAGGEGETPGQWHLTQRVMGVGDEIHDHLVQLVGICPIRADLARAASLP